MFKINPYKPGAGVMPSYLAGRDDIVNSVSQMFDMMKHGGYGQSIVFSGLRGVGKTVLLNKLYSIAEEKDFFCKHFEVENQKSLLTQISTCSKMFLQKHSTKVKIKNIFDNAVNVLKGFQISFCPDDGSISLSQQDKFLYTSNDLYQSMVDLFCALGSVAKDVEMPICFFIDEMQYIDKNELGSIITALHRTTQLGYPIMVIGAGLPKIYKMLSDTKSYTERLFYYDEIGSLTKEQSRDAIVEPLKYSGISYTDEAIECIYGYTKGYPFFIQQFCSILFMNKNGKVINKKDVESLLFEFYKILDNGFFKVRYERCPYSEKEFIFAMVKCGELPCTISNVAKNLKKSTTKISPIRGKLMDKGIVYSARYSELDFTVPEFDNFIKRCDEYKQWEIEKTMAFSSQNSKSDQAGGTQSSGH